MNRVMGDQNTLAGIMSAASGPSHRFMLDWLTIASRGSVTDVVYLISLALSSHLTPFHSLIPSTF